MLVAQIIIKKDFHSKKFLFSVKIQETIISLYMHIHFQSLAKLV